MTRCVPGDLAVCVRSTANNYGKLFTVLKWAGTYTFADGIRSDDCWTVRCEQDINGRDQSLRIIPLSYRRGDEVLFPDSYLRPIRDPGDSAKDETLQRIPTPYLERA